MSTGAVITHGFGSPGSASLVITGGLTSSDAAYVPGTFAAQISLDIAAFLALDAGEDLSIFLEADMGFAVSCVVGADTFSGILESEPDKTAARLHCEESAATAYLSPGVRVTVGGIEYWVEEYVETNAGIAVIRVRMVN